jgi:hypothetical protein
VAVTTAVSEFLIHCVLASENIPPGHWDSGQAKCGVIEKDEEEGNATPLFFSDAQPDGSNTVADGLPIGQLPRAAHGVDGRDCERLLHRMRQN